MADTYKIPIHELLLAMSGGAGRVSTDSGPNKPNAGRVKLSFEHSAPNKPHERNTLVLPNLLRTRRNSLPDWRDHFEEAQRLNRSRCFLTSWETNFVADLIARGMRWPSPKQAIVIIRILEKAAVFGAASAAADWEDAP